MHRLTTRSLDKTGRHPARILGLITPATNVDDPTLIGPLLELESQIIERANWLADELHANPPAWYCELRRTASTTSDQELRELARAIAAYRERYEIPSDSILGDAPPANAGEQHRERSRLFKAMAGFSSQTPNQPTHDHGIQVVPTRSVSPQPD
ncbi:hypothetical protein [Kribbella hippodromi]|uniref:hypothetical protein n=1 Tax=Kribbella hippodromi TaxID=434347 RepID=UPI0031DB0E99